MKGIADLAAGVLRGDRVPWITLGMATMAILATLAPGWWIYDRSAVEGGELWRLVTANLVHHGWMHAFFDVGLFLILGRLLEWKERWFFGLACLVLGLLATGAVHIFDPSMSRYAGLSGVSAGLLIYGALQGWQRRWTDWFWPAVLVLYAAELVEEHVFGRGMVQFNAADIRIATVAHLGGIAGGVLLWLVQRRRLRRMPAAGGPASRTRDARTCA